MLGRQSVWSDATLHELAKEFVPAGDEVFRLMKGSDEESRFFQEIARQGYAGMREGVSQQGTYIFAPSGEFLGSDNTRDPRRMERLIRSGLAKWRALPREKRLRSTPFPGRPARAEGHYPKDGLVLRSFTRDWPRSSDSGAFANAWNTDILWFRADEMRSLLPDRLAKGAKKEIPAALVQRIARFHLIDTVRGQNQPYSPSSVEASMTLEVVEVRDGAVTLRMTGAARCEDRGRGFEGTLLGRAVWKRDRFTTFDLVALGRQWGNLKRDSDGSTHRPGTMGVAFRLADPEDPTDRVAPTFFPAYGGR